MIRTIELRAKLDQDGGEYDDFEDAMTDFMHSHMGSNTDEEFFLAAVTGETDDRLIREA